jgi:hypothetical protein
MPSAFPTTTTPWWRFSTACMIWATRSGQPDARETLQSDGSAMVVEPMAGNVLEENFNPVGRVFSAASTLCCVPNSLAYGGPALGTVASEEALRAFVLEAGFTRFRRAAETPFNRIFEARL